MAFTKRNLAIIVTCGHCQLSILAERFVCGFHKEMDGFTN